MSDALAVDEYIASAPPEARAMLEELRGIIGRVAPDAVEAISYQVPTFKLFGGLVGFGYGKGHCSLYVMSSTLLDRFQDDLQGYDTSKGTVRFRFGTPIPVDLVERLVLARVDENEAGAVQTLRR
ncbi:MAG: DUF1801 domain-containing protein [Fimbriimonadaceae bacterium]|nr:DUF1801 domain-containing protein [Fimbriimonadaceae bacterium]